MERRDRQRDRRRQTFNSVLYGCLHPRRQANRRMADDQWCLVDVYGPGLVMVSLAIVLMSCLDAFFTLNLLAMGATEINYFMKALIETDVSQFVRVKLLGTCGGVLFLVVMARYRLAGVLPVRRVLEVLCGVYACLIIWELFLLALAATAPLQG